MKLKEILEGYEEITFTDGEDELMVHFDSKGVPIRAYVYNDSPLLNFDYDAYEMPRWAKGYEWKFEQSKKNPLFYNLVSNDIPTFVKWIKALGYRS